RRADEVLENPLAAAHGGCPVGVGRDRQDAAMAKQSAAVLVSDRDAPVLAAVDIRNAVVPRQALIHERVVGRQQLEDTPVVVKDALEEQLCFPLEPLAQI